ncbi:unnamed protein product [Camellia sinensis]
MGFDILICGSSLSHSISLRCRLISLDSPISRRLSGSDSDQITGQSCPLSFKGSPYWMAPEVIKNPTGCNLAVDIWSLGCTVLEMATGKPPWSQYEGVAALFKIGNSKELPAIPENLSDEGKDFVRLCLQRNPLHRPTAAKLLEHPFVNNAATFERPILDSEPPEPSPTVTNALRSLGKASHRENDLLNEIHQTVRCGKNKLNREKLKVLHTAGSKAFRKVQYDERDRATGEELGLVELYKKTHFSEKKEAWVHADAEIRHVLQACVDLKLGSSLLDFECHFNETIEKKMR